MAVRLVVACLHLCMLCFGAVANDTHACSTLFGHEELHRLGRVFTGQDIRARKSNSRSKEQPITWVAASRIDADLAARLRTLYREDDMIHEWVCSRYSSTQATPGQNSSASGTHSHARASFDGALL